MHLEGIDGRGEILAIVDTGVDADSCVFAETDGSLPPVNTGTPAGGLSWQNVDLSRRKIVAYNFLFSCDQYPGRSDCDDPSDPRDWDNHGHGTGTASMLTGDRAPFGEAGNGEAIAPRAQLVVQDTGFLQSSLCQLPGLGCPATDLTPVFEQAYRQGARIQSQQWGDRMGTYSLHAEQLDAFVASHPDFVVVFLAGNTGRHGPGSVSAPGLAKNAIQAGGTRQQDLDDSVVWSESARGPAEGGRIKPDLVVPSYINGTWGNGRVDQASCQRFNSAGTSWAAPLLAGTAALVRQYYREGFYPRGSASARDSFLPSAALVKATLIASARRVPWVAYGPEYAVAQPVPSFEQGFGFPVLTNVLAFDPASPRMRIADRRDGLAQGETAALRVRTARVGALSATLVWTDPPGAALVHDLDLELIGPAGARATGNAPLTGGAPDRANNVEKAAVESAAAGEWVARVHGFRVRPGETQPFAIVVAGELEPEAPARRRLVSR